MKTRLALLICLLPIIPLQIVSAEAKWRENKPYVFWPYYADLHPELIAAFGYDDNELRQHFAEIGLDLGLRSSPVMDVRWYLENNPDLQRAFGATNYRRALSHWRKHGMTEGRAAHPGFDPRWYLANNPDVKAWAGTREPFRRSVEHYMNYGYFEGRRGSPLSAREIEYNRPNVTIPTDPTNPTIPTDPTDPTDPTNPTDPTDPANPTNPTNPTDPANPTDPSDPDGEITLPIDPGPTPTTPRRRIIIP